ncbi:S6 family peptidase, partial [Streptobacillus moniliformis]|uniref:S6 family peptidase n=1 Tax=Streptobacillus moniliformis TaxID=34105 RepID=UPI0009C19A98
IRLAQGAKLTITRANQIGDNNVVFAHRGGTLNLNGNDLEFKDIYHRDKDARIVNDKEDNENKRSKFTFKPSGGNRVFLGSFKGNLDLVYNPDKDDSKWSIRSEETDIKGDFNIEKGNVIIEGDRVIHGSDNTEKESDIFYDDEYRETKFKSKTINIKEKSTLTVGRATEVDSTISVEKGAKLELDLLGKVVNDRLKPYEEAKSEEEINKTVVKGKIEFKSNNSENYSTNITNFKAKVENNHIAVIKSELKGEIKGIKEGKGLLYLSHEDNSSLKGTLEVKEGKLKVKKASTLGNSKVSVTKNAILEVEDKNEIEHIFDKIDKASEGTLNIREDIDELNGKYKDLTKLFLVATKDLSITKVASGINTLNLDASDKSTLTLKSINNSVSKVNIGNGNNKGTISIESVSNTNTDFTINKDSTVNFLNDTQVNKVENGGNINLKDSNLKINEYNSKGGVFNIHLTKTDNKVLEIENTDKDVEAKLKLEKSVIDKVVDDGERIDIVKIKGHNLNISNLKDYESVYKLGIENKEGTFKLFSSVKGEVISNLYIFNELDLVNDMSNELRYRNVIEANYINYNKIDKDYLKIESSTEYKNKLSTNGVDINFEKASYIVSGGINFNVLVNNLTTEVKDSETVNTNFVSIGAIPKIGIKYGLFDISLGLGLNILLVNNGDKLAYLNHSLNVGLNPRFSISKDIGIRYLNRVGYRVNPLLSNLDRYTISHKRPINLYYETGIRLEHKYIDFFSKANVGYNFSSYDVSKNNKSITNTFKDDWRVNVRTGFEIKPTDSIFINLNFDANVYQKTYARYIFGAGIGYNW